MELWKLNATEAAAVRDAISSVEHQLDKSGRLLIRKSGTEPLIRVMVECEDEGLLDETLREVVTAVRDAAGG